MTAQDTHTHTHTHTHTDTHTHTHALHLHTHSRMEIQAGQHTYTLTLTHIHACRLLPRAPCLSRSLSSARLERQVDSHWRGVEQLAAALPASQGHRVHDSYASSQAQP